MLKAKHIFILLLLFSISKRSVAQLVIDTTQTPQQLVQNVLLGNGVVATNIQCNCQKLAMGYFDGVNSNIGMIGGLLLTTGNAFEAIGPNNNTAQTTSHPGSFNDPNLMQIEPSAVNDVCILEFDFKPDSSYLEFKYSFGSEEYPEFVNSAFNDAFGFFLSGPGIANGTNIAMVPATTTPIAINNLNNGTACPSTGPCTNCIHYIDNCSSGPTVQYDGFTTVLTAKANVLKDSVYHIKLAIADAGDHAFDSGVFLECGSFSSTDKTYSNCSFTGLNNSIVKGKIHLFPNPTNDLLTVTLVSEAIKYDLFNYLGDIYKTGLVSGPSFTISASDLANGLYVLKTYDAKGQYFYQKFIKE